MLKKNLFTLLYTLITISNTDVYYSFTSNSKHQGYNIQKKLKKHLNKDLGEDSYYISSAVLALSDGSESSQFTSKYMSKLLTNAAALSVIESTDEEGSATDTMADKMADCLVDRLDGYRKAARDALDEFLGSMREDGNRGDIKNNIMSARGTLVGAYLIDQDTDEPKLRIFQTGNSLFMKFEPVYDKKTDDMIYWPLFVTSDMRTGVNNIPELSDTELTEIEDLLDNMDKNNNHNYDKNDILQKIMKKRLNRQLKEFEVPVTEDDILLLGSDGLFDNVPTPLIFVFVNYIVAKIEEAEEIGEEIEEPKELLNKLTNQYFRLFEKNNENVIIELFKELNARSDFEKLVLDNFTTDIDLQRPVYEDVEDVIRSEDDSDNDSFVNDVTMITYDHLRKTKIVEYDESVTVDNNELFKMYRRGRRIENTRDLIETLGDRLEYLQNIRNNANKSKINNDINKIIKKYHRLPYEVKKDPRNVLRVKWNNKAKDSTISKYLNESSNTFETTSMKKRKSKKSRNNKYDNEAEELYYKLEMNSNSKSNNKNNKINGATETSASSSFFSKFSFKNIMNSFMNVTENKAEEKESELTKKLKDFNLANCDWKSYLNIEHDTKIRYINTVPVTKCIYDMIKDLGITKTKLSADHFAILSEAIGHAAKKIAKKGSITVRDLFLQQQRVSMTGKKLPSPFAIKAMLYGELRHGTKSDDITVVTSGIEQGDYDSEILEEDEDELNDQFKKLKKNLKKSGKEFLSNLLKNENKEEFRKAGKHHSSRKVIKV